MSSLMISHNIFLNKKQRYALHAGETIEVFGVSVPVWIEAKYNSEPAEEIFCKYILTNQDKSTPIYQTEEGYEINLPQISEPGTENLTSEALLDVSDGGAGGSLEFREHSKIHLKSETLDVYHFVEIKTEETLLRTLVYCE